MISTHRWSGQLPWRSSSRRRASAAGTAGQAVRRWLVVPVSIRAISASTSATEDKKPAGCSVPGYALDDDARMDDGHADVRRPNPHNQFVPSPGRGRAVAQTGPRGDGPNDRATRRTGIEPRSDIGSGNPVARSWPGLTSTPRLTRYRSASMASARSSGQP